MRIAGYPPRFGSATLLAMPIRPHAAMLPHSDAVVARRRSELGQAHPSWGLILLLFVVSLALPACPPSAPEPAADRWPSAPVPAPAPPPPPPADLRVLFDQPSAHGRVIVVETAGRRCLKFSMDGGDQSCLDLQDPKRVVHEYIRLLPVGLLFAPPSPKTLMVGLGGGRAVQLLLDHDPQVVLDVVELNPVVVDVARRYFDVRPSERLRIHVADGRAFLREGRDRWDLVVLDAFGNDFIPFHLTTVEFLRSVSSHLTAGGAVVANVWTRNDRLFRAMVKTYAEVFSRVYVFRALHVGNAIVVAVAREAPASCAEVERLAAERSKRWTLPFPFVEQPAQCESVASLDLSDVPLLSDAERAAFDGLGPL